MNDECVTQTDFNTFGGSAASMSVALATLTYILDHSLQSQALRVGDYLMSALRRIQHASLRFRDVIGDIRGKGMYIGVEFIKSRDTLEPASELAVAVCNGMVQAPYRVLTGTDGVYNNGMGMMDDG